MGGMGSHVGTANDLASMLACGSQTPMRWPDGSFAPSLPFQARFKHYMGTGSTGSDAIVVQGDDPSKCVLHATGVDAFGAVTWPPPSRDTNNDWEANVAISGFLNEIAAIRTTGIRICGKYLGATGTDGGRIIVKSGYRSSLDDGQQDYLDEFPNSPSDASLVDFSAPLREGFEAILQPADPTSRKYRAVKYVSPLDGDDSSPIDQGWNVAIQQLQTEVGDRWPYLFIEVVGATANAVAIFEVEIVVDFEFQPLPRTIAARGARPSPPDDPTFRSELGNAARKISQAGTDFTSRAAATAVGGIEELIKKTILGGASAVGRAVAGSAMLMMSRAMRRPMVDFDRPTLRIQEL